MTCCSQICLLSLTSTSYTQNISFITKLVGSVLKDSITSNPKPCFYTTQFTMGSIHFAETSLDCNNLTHQSHVQSFTFFLLFTFSLFMKIFVYINSILSEKRGWPLSFTASNLLWLCKYVLTKLCGCEKMRGLIKTLTHKRLLIFSLQHMIDVKCNWHGLPLTAVGFLIGRKLPHKSWNFYFQTTKIRLKWKCFYSRTTLYCN